MSHQLTEDANFCTRKPQHGNQKLKYLCLESSCDQHRVLCRKCVNEDHRKHKVGVIDKLIEPLSRLCMNSGSDNSASDYQYMEDRLKEICEEWQKINELIFSHVKELQEGILLQFTTLMKTFKTEQVDKAYETLMDNKSKPEEINDIVEVLQFLNKDYMQDVDSVKKFTDYISERVKRSISKTVKKVDFILNKMQSYIKELDFTMFQHFNENAMGAAGDSRDKSFDKIEQDPKLSSTKKEDEIQDETKKMSNQKRVSNQPEPQQEVKLSKLHGLGGRKSAFQRYH